GLARLGTGEKQNAAESFSAMLALVGDSAWSRVLVGRAYLKQNLADEATKEFQAALRIDPRAADAHYFWGRALLQANDWKPTPEVESHFLDELRVNPRHFLANYLLGVFAWMNRKYGESEGYLRMAAQLNPSLPEVWMYLGLNAHARKAEPLAE